MIKTAEQKNLAVALERLTYRQTWSLCVEALRQFRKRTNGEVIQFEVATLQDFFYPLMRSHLSLDASTPFFGLQQMLGEPCAVHLLEFLLWLERAGLAYHLGRDGGQSYVRFLRLLPAGIKFFDSVSDDDSPYSHGWSRRMRKQCPGLTDEIVSLLDDALACFDQGLKRPAVALLGVAFEAAVIDVCDALQNNPAIATKQLKLSKQPKAHEYISAVRSAIDDRLADKDDREAARDACRFADDLRRRRNDASHAGGKSIEDPGEVDELFMQAARKLPQLWQLR